MMLSTIESFFVRLLRGTVIATAFLSFLTAVLAIFYVGYAEYAPEPTAKTSQQVERFRKATNPSKLIKELFPSGSDISKEMDSTPDQTTYVQSKHFDEEIFAEFNKFLDIGYGASFDDQSQFSDWLHGTNRIPFSWSNAIDDKNASNDDNINNLWRSLLFDYARRLTFRAPAIANVRKLKTYPTSIDALTNPTAPSRAPYFLAWFFNRLQNELQLVGQDLQAEKGQREALRLSMPFALSVAAGAFSYFIFIMFMFLLVSIEASVRLLANK
jgi:hypothetical protein